MSHTLLINPTAMEAGLLAAAKARALPPARGAAFEAFAKTGLPHKRMEAWKWTDLRQFLRDELAPSAPEDGVIAPSAFSGVGAFEITIMNGAAEWSGERPRGLTITQARADIPLTPLAADHPLANLALALSETRLDIFVEPGAHIDRPILIRRMAGPGASHAQARLSVGPGASVTVIESFDGAGKYFANSVTEFHLGDGAALTRFVLQDGSDEGVETSLWTGELDGDAVFSAAALLLGAKACRFETRLHCRGDGARLDLKSASALGRARHADATSLVIHDAEDCTTRQLHKSALKDRARGVFQGKFLVERGAQKTDAQMNANALLLSEKAEADHKPELEIYADDVQCAHGATSGALDEDALFYMRQRGLDEEAAKTLLIEAFLGDVFSGIAHSGVHAVFERRLKHWLGGAQ